MGCGLRAASEYIPTERIAIVVWRLRDGDKLSTADIAVVAGLTYKGAWTMMQKLSRVLPVCQTEGGLWKVC